MGIKIDPRVARTRKAIIESFIQLSERKPFENISVKDITEEALINRATFYNHFLDKYDLMEKALFEDVQLKLNREEYSEVQLNEDYIVSLFEKLCSFHMRLATQCQRSYIVTINQLVVDQLKVIHSQQLKKHFESLDEEEIHKIATIFASGLFSLSQEWFDDHDAEEPATYVKDAIPFLKVFIKQ
ncbi:MAG TPA: TetR family transcriptional regulator [Aerococcaceae bacterium]|nr:TetR family transcriptional regulator [Aerococcaceae bacterium]